MLRALTLALFFTLPAIAADGQVVLREAMATFAEAKTDAKKYAEAATLFAKAAQLEELKPEQNAAWVYCRLRVAAEEWNASKGDAAIGKRVIAEVESALTQVPDHAELQKFGRDVLIAAGVKPKTMPVATKAADAKSGWFALESDSFKVRYPAAAKSMAEAVLKAAEEQRSAIFTRWSGPAGSAWNVKCEIVLHPSANDFAHATQQPSAATGHALVNLNAGEVTLRRIDLRVDDSTMTMDALPRELTHIILADLFPTTPPPKWAAEGMATQAMSAETLDRYRQTAAKYAKAGKLPQAMTLLETTTTPSAEAVTGFAVGSAALAEFLIKQKGDRSLTVFLRDSKRYGIEKSLERQFGFANFSDLDQQWRKFLQQ